MSSVEVQSGSMKALLIVLFFQTFSFYGSEASDINSLVSQCSAKDPKLSDCLKKYGEKFMLEIGAGVPEMNIPPLDPLYTPSVSFTNEEKDSTLVVNYQNIIQKGISNIIIEDAQIDFDKQTMFFKLKYPVYSFQADYDTSGVMFDMKVSGQGKANATVWDSTMTIDFKYHVENDHIKLDSVIVSQHYEKIYLDYTNIVINDDKELSESASTFINENSAEILNGFKPGLEKFYAGIIKENLQPFFDSVPYSTLFKDL